MGFLTLDDLPRVEDTGEPRLSIHRAGMQVAPENSIQALDLCLSWDVQLVEIDVYGTIDGSSVVIHDSRTARTTDSDVNCDFLTSMACGGIRLDPHKSLETGVTDTNVGWMPEPLPTLDSVFRKFAGKMCFVVELKNDRALQGILDTILRHDMQNSVIVHTQGLGNKSRLDLFIAAGITVMLAPGQPLDYTLALDIKQYGIDWVSLGGSNGVLSSVQAAKNALLKVSIALPNMRFDYEKRLQDYVQAGIMVDEVLTDQPLYIRGTRHRTTGDPWGSGTFYHGHHGLNSDTGARVKGTFTRSGAGWQFNFPTKYNPATGAAGEDQLLMGWACPLESESFTFEFKFKALEAGTFPRLIVPVCHETDEPWNEWTGTLNGYMPYFNGNGDLRIYRHDGSNNVNLGSTSTSGFSAGDTVHLKLEITPTQIKWSRTNGSNPKTVVANDGSYRGKYLWLGTRHLRARFYNLKIT